MKQENLSQKVLDFIRTTDESSKYRINQKNLKNYE